MLIAKTNCTHIINDEIRKYNNRPYKNDRMPVVFFTNFRYNDNGFVGSFLFLPRNIIILQQIAQFLYYNIFEAMKEDHSNAYFEISGSAQRRYF